VAETPDDLNGKAIPSGRLSRMAVFGRMATGVAGNVVAEGARRFAEGQRPRMSELLLTPKNVTRVTDQLSQLRGAAMKLGQMISLDAGEFLPPELSDIMARLRNNAHRMPPAQLQKVLADQWGANWRTRFKRFGAGPIAAASIGQVHRATTPDGRDLAVKVQYPGVRDSIDADIDNVATLLRISGLLPKEIDLAPLLAEAKRQLHEEADYAREAAQMTRFGALLAGHPAYVVPIVDDEFSTDQVLAMSFVEGVPIESIETATQETRDTVITTLITLVLRELFEFGLMQTDPNFANYRYQPETGRLVLLDFGAARTIKPATAQGYCDLLKAGLAGNRNAMRDAAVASGFIGDGAVAHHRARLDAMIDIVIAQMTQDGPFDFADRSFVGVLRDQGMDIAADRATWHIPPVDTLFVQRKISGTALLAARLGARVDMRGLLGAMPGFDGITPTETIAT
jgi:predicted unusual protein kinase regulating ubiquinone biosynthesis (AarF/ABC1/UbiB family)